MQAWFIWLIIAVLFIIIEMATVGFFLMWFAVAAAITALLSLFFPTAYVAQFVIWAILSVLLVTFTKKFTDKVKPETTPTNVYSIIRKRALVTVAINNENATGQVKVDGDIWSARSENYEETIAVGESVEILRVDGVKVIVKKLEKTEKSEKTEETKNN